MYNKSVCSALIAFLILSNNVYGKKLKRIKRPTNQEDLTTTIRPSVITYSTFGFNDVRSYDGFVPTAPDYASYLSGQEPSTRLYAPAFPSAADSTGLNDDYTLQTLNGHNYAEREEGTGPSGMSQYTSQLINDQNKYTDRKNKPLEDSDAPLFGTKLENKYKGRPSYQQTNAVELETPSGKYSNLSDGKYTDIQKPPATRDGTVFNELNYDNTNKYRSKYELQQVVNDSRKPDSSNVQNTYEFPRVVDFTKLSNTYYPTGLDTSKLMSDSIKHSEKQMSMADFQITNGFRNQNNNKNIIYPTTNTEPDKLKNYDESNYGKDYNSNIFLAPHFGNQRDILYQKHNQTGVKKLYHKKKANRKPWDYGNYSSPDSDWRNSSMIGYGYSSNYSNTNFKHDFSDPKNLHHNDELVSESSNDYASYQFPQKDYGSFKKMPEYNNNDDYFSSSLLRDKLKSSDYYPNYLKNTLSTTPTTFTSNWGNTIKTLDYSSFGQDSNKPIYSIDDTDQDDVVIIPRKPHRPKVSESKPYEWWQSPYKSQKLTKPNYDWTKEYFNSRYKSEEDLLNLRTRDTSRPSYAPNYNDDDNFKQLVEKWKENYISSKYKDVRDDDAYGSEKPEYVPIPKPHTIEVPHPVIVPVPRPFPVRVPISKPVAVPVIHELTIPIEKPVFYPVYKNVPYPVETLVPVPVEKEVTVPIEKPYPVRIPHVRPLFHHIRPLYEDHEEIDGEDYQPRPEFKRPSQFRKRPSYSSSHSITRRPLRTSYEERSKRRSPDRRRPTRIHRDLNYNPQPFRAHHSRLHRDRDLKHEDDDYDQRRYNIYCRKTGKC